MPEVRNRGEFVDHVCQRQHHQDSLATFVLCGVEWWGGEPDAPVARRTSEWYAEQSILIMSYSTLYVDDVHFADNYS